MAKYTWSRENTFELIHLYEKHALLWDRTCKDYKKREKKVNVILNIAEKFDTTKEEINRKLHNLRNQLSQELNKIKKKKDGDDSDETYTSNWPYFSALKFLIPGLTKRSAVTNVDQLSKEKVSTQYSSYREEESKKKIIEVIERRGKKRAKFVAEEDFKDSAQILSKEPDDYDTFGEYVAMELRSLRSDENKRRLKAEIRRAICRIADLDDATIYASCASPNTSQSCPLPSSSSSSSTYHIP
ncbi:uncharacterized protein LOC128877055 [Hylaeus volcanicus]|uniref:uncharacterized protein LOC128877055 n=1 Tax=Hylaeus volcanicus TaxID=313075 RepID=UPI0023B80C67|nr:uncharacterized protein LOC128877055 [Hylaeus volcanicus]